MNKIKEKYLISSLVISAIFGVALFVVVVLILDIVNYSDNFIEAKAEFFSLKNKDSILQKEENYQNLDNYYQSIYQLFSNQEKPIEEVFFLRNIAQKYNLSIDVNFTKENKRALSNWPYLDFRVNLSGHMDNILEFIKEIENNPKIIEINRLIVTKDDRNFSDQRQSLKAELNLKFYFLENEHRK